MISFRLFCIGTDPIFFKRRAFLLDVADKLEAFFFNTEQKIFNLSMPPRMGKSYMLTLFSVWSFAQKFNGQTKIFRVCAENSLYQDFSKQTQFLTEKMSGLLGFEPISGTIDRWYIGDSTLPHFFGGGFGGNITGRGGNIAIFDDMYRGYTDAISAAYDRDLDFFLQSVVRGRMEGDNYKIINVGTRWTVNDWFSKFVPDVEILVPALNEQDETVCDSYKSTHELFALKDTLQDYIWSAQFMQRPTAQGRQRLFSADYFTFGKEADIPSTARYFTVIDPASDFGKDYFVAGLYAKDRGQCWLVDMFAEQSAKLSDVAAWLNSNNTRYRFIETNGMGQNIRQQLEKDYRLFCIPFSTNKDKYSRAWMASEWIRDSLTICNFEKKELFLQQASEFPTSEHDDLIDNVVMAFENFNKL